VCPAFKRDYMVLTDFYFLWCHLYILFPHCDYVSKKVLREQLIVLNIRQTGKKICFLRNHTSSSSSNKIPCLKRFLISSHICQQMAETAYS
jgi:hypothetical protein